MSEENETTRERTPDYAQGHLVIAAVRILEHRNGKPPTYEEIGGLLGISHEVIGAVARALRSHGAVKILETPFDTRLEVDDHTLLENLPREQTTAAMKGEVDAFLERSRSKQEDIESLFKSGEYEKKKKEKFAGLDQQLKDFKKKKISDPFAPAGSDEEDAGEQSTGEQAGGEQSTGEQAAGEQAGGEDGT